jgi:putative tryptophan/tyrosine transport system substrate-binding protein
MMRRAFIAGFGAIAWPMPAFAQRTPGKIWRIGMLETIPQVLNAVNIDALRKGLGVLGYVEGQHYVVEYRSADGQIERFPALAAELVRSKVDVIVTRGTPAVVAAKAATTTIPIIMASSGAPLATKVVDTLAHPGGNVTGLSAITDELTAKRLEFLTEMSPGLKKIAYLHNMSNPIGRSQWEELRAAAQKLGIDAQIFDLKRPEDIEPAVEAASKQRAALIVGNDSVTHMGSQQLVELAAKHRLPAIYGAREFVDAGGLVSYAVSYADLYRHVATYIDKIFKGASPADLPVEQPTNIELVVNLGAAKALGITIPPSILIRADEVIE